MSVGNAAFGLEAEMLAPVRWWLEGQGFCTAAEYATPTGICDLVGVGFSMERARCRIRLGQQKAVARVELLETLDAIPEEVGIALADVADALGKRTEDIAPLVEWLATGHFVCLQADQVRKRNGWAPIADRVVAVELKLSRALEAVHQAYLRTAFATEVMVAMPGAAVARVLGSPLRIREFEERGVGLLAVALNGCEIMLPPATRPARDKYLHAQCAEKLWPRFRGSAT